MKKYNKPAVLVTNIEPSQIICSTTWDLNSAKTVSEQGSRLRGLSVYDDEEEW